MRWYRRWRWETGIGCQGRSKIGPLPREVVTASPSEMAIGGGLAINRSAEVEPLNDPGRSQIEVAPDEALDHLFVTCSVPKVSKLIETGSATPIA